MVSFDGEECLLPESNSSDGGELFIRRGVLQTERSSSDGEEFFRRRGALQTEENSFQTERSSSEGSLMG